MKKLLSALLMLIFCFALSACAVDKTSNGPDIEPTPFLSVETDIEPAPSPVAAQSDPNKGYRLEKLNQVSDMILNREIVPTDYLRYLDEELASAVEQYNNKTAALRISYTSQATNTVKTLFYEHQEDPGDYAHSDMYYEWIGRISHYALYENVSELCNNDPYLSYTLAKEAGGSGGLWAYRFHLNATPSVQEETQAYFSLVDELLDKLDTARSTAAETNDKD